MPGLSSRADGQAGNGRVQDRIDVVAGDRPQEEEPTPEMPSPHTLAMAQKPVVTTMRPAKGTQRS